MKHPDASTSTFQQTMLGMSYDDSIASRADIFSRACIEQYKNHKRDQFGYQFAQVFETNVLQEIALLNKISFAAVETLDFRPTPALQDLYDRSSEVESLSMEQAVNTAAALISISRFHLATVLLRKISNSRLSPRVTFEIWMLRFVIANRTEDIAGMSEAFSRMRRAIDGGGVPRDRVLDACSQAVVWYMKKKVTDEPMFKWFVSRGRSVVATEGEYIDPSSVSGWYRALAMVPAAEKNAPLTRHLMEVTRENANRSISQHRTAYDLHFIKTYYESTLKEHMYVTGNLEEAVTAGRALIELDPNWSPSYGELGEAYLFFGSFDAALNMYKIAIELGPPYYGHHLHQAAKLATRIESRSEALGLYDLLIDLVPGNETIVRERSDLKGRAEGVVLGSRNSVAATDGSTA